MSRLLYFASDAKLKEKPNPYILSLSINEAIAKGIKIDLDILKNTDGDKPGTILWVESEEHFNYPDIKTMNIFCDPIGTNKCYRMEIEGNVNKSNVDCILNYIKEHVINGIEIEFWKIWLGEEEKLKNVKKKSYALSDITSELLLKFIKSNKYPDCIVISKSVDEILTLL